MSEGDHAEIEEETALTLTSDNGTEFLLFDLG